MLSTLWEAFTRMIPTHTPDGLGGDILTLTAGEALQAALGQEAGSLTEELPRAVAVRATLLYPAETDIRPGAYLRRERDSTLWQAAGDGQLCESPRCAGLRLRQTPVICVEEVNA